MTQAVMSFEEAVDRWRKLRQQINLLAAQENTLRSQIFSAVFQQKEGTQSFTLADGAILKGTYPINRSVDDDAWRLLRAKLIAENAINPDNIVTYKPSLSLREYKKLDPAIKRRVDRVITAKPGMPSLVIE